MTQKEAKELTLEVWRYLAEHPECKLKRDVPQGIYDKVKYLAGECPLCQTYFVNSCSCRECPLNKAGKDCGEDYSPWRLWYESRRDDSNTRREAAKRIVEIVSAWEPEEE